MRAKLALAMAAFGLISIQPSIALTDLQADVNDILFDQREVTITQPAVICPAGTPTTVSTTAEVNALITSKDIEAGGSPMRSTRESTRESILLEIPAVMAPTSTGVAIITEIPSDIDIRREDLARRISEGMKAGAVSAMAGADMNTALQTIAAAEVEMRKDGLLDYKETKKLYRAMDQIGSDLDYYTNPGSTRLLGVRLVPNAYSFPWL
jgi:hypothetical protein